MSQSVIIGVEMVITSLKGTLVPFASPEHISSSSDELLSPYKLPLAKVPK